MQRLRKRFLMVKRKFKKDQNLIFLPLNVMDVARYVVNYSNEKDYGISNPKLQKVLYFIQAYFLIREKVPCFSEEIEAWAFGPVVPEVYEEFESSGSCDIPYIKTYRIFRDRGLFSLERCEFDDLVIPDAVKREINRVVDRLAGYSATDLTEITMRQDPWENAYVPGEQNEITTESIRKYFGKGRKNESQTIKK